MSQTPKAMRKDLSKHKMTKTTKVKKTEPKKAAPKSLRDKVKARKKMLDDL